MVNKINIYFDIDGVLKGSASPTEDVEALVTYCLRRYPHSIYWLTTHCKGGTNDVKKALRGVFGDELVNQICNTFQPTDWKTLKTEAIDFSGPFVWFDDTVLQAELDVVEKKTAADVTYGLFLMDKKDPFSACDALAYLKMQESIDKKKV